MGAARVTDDVDRRRLEFRKRKERREDVLRKGAENLL
jgi:hypothetical protein